MLHRRSCDFVLSLTKEEPLGGHVSDANVPINVDENNRDLPIGALDLHSAVRVVRRAMDAGYTVHVNCREGKNRSCLVCAAYAMWYKGADPAALFRDLTARGHLQKPAARLSFWHAAESRAAMRDECCPLTVPLRWSIPSQTQRRVLDVGTGRTASMIASLLSPGDRLTALEPDERRWVPAGQSLGEVECMHATLRQFAAQNSEQFDLITSFLAIDHEMPCEALATLARLLRVGGVAALFCATSPHVIAASHVHGPDCRTTVLRHTPLGVFFQQQRPVHHGGAFSEVAVEFAWNPYSLATVLRGLGLEPVSLCMEGTTGTAGCAMCFDGADGAFDVHAHHAVVAFVKASTVALPAVQDAERPCPVDAAEPVIDSEAMASHRRFHKAVRRTFYETLLGSAHFGVRPQQCSVHAACVAQLYYNMPPFLCNGALTSQVHMVMLSNLTTRTLQGAFRRHGDADGVFVSPKLDGVRCLLLYTDQGLLPCYRRSAGYAPQLDAHPTQISGVVDCESYESAFYAFESLFWNGCNLTNKAFKDRIPAPDAARENVRLKPWLRAADAVQLDWVAALRGDTSATFLDAVHKVDGLVFAHADAPFCYVSFGHGYAYRYKKPFTIDVKAGEYPVHGTKSVGHIADGRVYECVFRGRCAYALRERSDKASGNHPRTVRQIMLQNEHAALDSQKLLLLMSILPPYGRTACRTACTHLAASTVGRAAACLDCGWVLREKHPTDHKFLSCNKEIFDSSRCGECTDCLEMPKIMTAIRLEALASNDHYLTDARCLTDEMRGALQRNGAPWQAVAGASYRVAVHRMKTNNPPQDATLLTRTPVFCTQIAEMVQLWVFEA